MSADVCVSLNGCSWIYVNINVGLICPICIQLALPLCLGWFGSVELSDVQNIVDPLKAVQAGLVSSADAPVPLKAVHVRARLVDLAAQVLELVIAHNYKQCYIS